MLFILTCVLLTVLAWITKFCSINDYYKSYSNNTSRQYSLHEWVEFGQDYLDYSVSANGYRVRANSCKIINGDEFAKLIDYSFEDEQSCPEKLAIVTISLVNNNSTTEGVMLSELSLHGCDSIAYLNWDLLCAANPILENNLGIQTPPNTECTIVLPFVLSRQYYSRSTWENIDNYELFLRVTEYPTRKLILVNPT